MYELLYAPIPDVQAYLNRIHMGMPESPDLDYLNELIYAHQKYVVFEAMDPLLGYPVSLEIPTLFQKIILGCRGGYCFELNALFTQLLKDLGYTAYGCRCRTVDSRDYVPPIQHRGILVEFPDGLYFCDVGYGGPMPSGAICLKDGFTLNLRGEAYHIRAQSDNWWGLGRTTSSGNYEETVDICSLQEDNVDFLALNEYCAKSPDSDFVKMPLLNRRTNNGVVAIVGNTYTRVENRQTTVHTISSKAEFFQILENEFDLKLPL